jgi:hypothetical protein
MTTAVKNIEKSKYEIQDEIVSLIERKELNKKDLSTIATYIRTRVKAKRNTWSS